LIDGDVEAGMTYCLSGTREPLAVAELAPHRYG